MEILHQLQMNLLSPIILSFFLGMGAAFLKSDLRVPAPVQDVIALYLLFAIGMKGGVSLTGVQLGALVSPIAATVVLGVLTPLLAFVVLSQVGRLSVLNSAAIAAHYGSVSIITFIAAIAYLDAINVPHEGFMPALLVILEIPGIFVALLMVRLLKPGYGGSLVHAAKEVLSSKSVLLLVGGMVIGLVSGEEHYEKVRPFFSDIFPGFLCLFLLEMGIIAASRLKEVRTSGLFLIGFGILVPIIHGAIGAALGHFAGLSVGGATLLATLAASASYIAAPAAIRTALPDANPALYLTPSLVITFPFNIVFGIPIYYFIASKLAGL